MITSIISILAGPYLRGKVERWSPRQGILKNRSEAGSFFEWRGPIIDSGLIMQDAEIHAKMMVYIDGLEEITIFQFRGRHRFRFPGTGKGGTEMAAGGEGVCRFCGKTYSGSTMGRHLVACKVKKEKDAEEARGKEPDRIFHIRVAGGDEYWLHLELKTSSKLSDLDRFLRDIWLECCGHLSQFSIAGQSYMPPGAGGREMGARSMGIQLGRVLDVKERFAYEYDFGSTTCLEGRIVAERVGVLKEKVRILARNRMPEAMCEDCRKPAAWFCTECRRFLCKDCLRDHECGDDMALPVVNSPRVGECGYRGERDKDDFDKPKAPAGRAKKAKTS